MTQTDVKVSTDVDGTEHWERYLEPTLATDMIRDGYVFDHDRDSGEPDSEGYILTYGDHSGDFAEFAPFNAGVYSLHQEDDDAGINHIEQEVTVNYYDHIDEASLPGNATIEGYRYDYTYDASEVVTSSHVSITTDLWEGGIGGSGAFRPSSAGDALPMLRIRVDAVGTEVIPPIVPTTGSGTVEAQTDINTAALLVIRAYTDIWAIRTMIRPIPIAVDTDGSEGVVSVSLLSRYDPWQDDSYNPRFVIRYTVPGTTKPPPRIQQPRFHTARQVLDAHRQPSIRIGRRRY